MSKEGQTKQVEQVKLGIEKIKMNSHASRRKQEQNSQVSFKIVRDFVVEGTFFGVSLSIRKT